MFSQKHLCTLKVSLSFALSLSLPNYTNKMILTFMCFLSEDGCVYDLSQPLTRQLYGLSDVWTWECFFRSEELANLRSHPSCSHLNGFSPGINLKGDTIKIQSLSVRLSSVSSSIVVNKLRRFLEVHKVFSMFITPINGYDDSLCLRRRYTTTTISPFIA